MHTNTEKVAGLPETSTPQPGDTAAWPFSKKKGLWIGADVEVTKTQRTALIPPTARMRPPEPSAEASRIETNVAWRKPEADKQGRATKIIRDIPKVTPEAPKHEKIKSTSEVEAKPLELSMAAPESAPAVIRTKLAAKKPEARKQNSQAQQLELVPPPSSSGSPPTTGRTESERPSGIKTARLSVGPGTSAPKNQTASNRADLERSKHRPVDVSLGPRISRFPKTSPMPSRNNTKSAAKRPEISNPDRPATNSKSKSILVVGDSLSVGIGQALAKALNGRDGYKVIQKGKVSSGLNSPKFFNWESKLRQLIQASKPDVLIVMIGGNDAHNGSGSPAWARNFKQKVQKFLQITSEKDVTVYWAAIPPMRDTDFTERVLVANSVMESACNSASNCNFVETWSVTSNKRKMFTKTIEVKGKPLTIRADDGAHFTHNGYMVLSQHILGHINASPDSL